MSARLDQIRARFDDRFAEIPRGDMQYLLGEVDRLIAQAEEERRAILEQPILRHCLYPGCLREFDSNAALSGRPTRESWRSDGWLMMRMNLGHICPEHAHLVAEDAHRPKWGRPSDAQAAGHPRIVLHCACDWQSPAAHWQGYAAAAWRNHLVTVNEQEVGQ